MRVRELRSAFTLLEIMVVVVIIGILLAIAVPKISDRLHASRIYATQATIRSAQTAIQLFEVDHDRLPGALRELVHPPRLPAGREVRKYLDLIPSDAWHAALVYNCPAQICDGDFDLYSKGPNGVDDHGQGDDVIPDWMKPEGDEESAGL